MQHLHDTARMTQPKPWTDADLACAEEYLQVDADSPSGLSWKKTRKGVRRAGQRAGYQRDDGYWFVGLNKRTFQAGRLVLLLSGDRPDDRTCEVDHIDGNPSNNHPSNLRWVDNDSAQSLNRTYNAKTGYRWTHKQPRHDSYFFQFVIPRTQPSQYVRGCGFATAEEAHAAAITERRKLGLPVPERMNQVHPGLADAVKRR